jgi:hypothetical protein
MRIIRDKYSNDPTCKAYIKETIGDVQSGNISHVELQACRIPRYEAQLKILWFVKSICVGKRKALQCLAAKRDMHV